VNEKTTQNDNFGIDGAEFLGERITNEDFSMGRAHYRPVSVPHPFGFRNLFSAKFHQMRKDGGRQGQAERCQPDGDKTDNDARLF
jgi:hypothetical protein